MYVVRGESTEITTYDEDGYLVGERVQIMRPEDIWFDQVSLTSARLGDFSQPNAFGRFDGFDDPNYYQGLLQKRLTKQITWSTDFTAAAGERTMRAGVAWTPSFGTFRLEAYERWREQPAGGLSLSGERQLARNFRAGLGYATIDQHYPALNSDRFLQGQRVYVMTAWAVAPWLNVTTFYTKAFKNDFLVPIDHRFDVVATYNALDTLRRTGRF